LLVSCGVDIGEALRTDEAWEDNINMTLKEIDLGKWPGFI
jgi:hypothetical protein